MNIFRKLVRNYRSIMHTVALTGVEGIERFFVFGDIIYCRLRYHCSQKEYLKYHFYKYKNSYRKNYILDHHIKLYKKYLSSPISLRSKYERFQQFKDDSSREIIMLPDCGEAAFLEFVKKHKKFVIKPNDGRAALGFQILNYTDENSARDIFRTTEKGTLCEEYVLQHKEMAKLNPSSLNTIRIVSIIHNHTIEILSAAVKIGGKADSIADNMHAGGIAATVDLSTGFVSTPGQDYAGGIYFEHPVSQCQILGFRIPFWEKAKQRVLDAHQKLIDAPIIGWDIAITESGIEIIEANTIPGHNLMQLMDQTPKGRKLFEVAKERKKRKSAKSS